jgi:hypothetical protein
MFSRELSATPPGWKKFLGGTVSGGIALLNLRLLSLTPPASRKRIPATGLSRWLWSLRWLSWFCSGNLEGCEIVAGGRSLAKTSVKNEKQKCTPKAVPEKLLIGNIYCEFGLMFSFKLSGTPPGWKEFLGGTVSGGIASLNLRLLSLTPPASRKQIPAVSVFCWLRSLRRRIWFCSGNLKGCEIVAGGRSTAKTSGKNEKQKCTPEAVPEKLLIRNIYCEFGLMFSGCLPPRRGGKSFWAERFPEVSLHSTSGYYL